MLFDLSYRGVEWGKNLGTAVLDKLHGRKEETRFRFIPLSSPKLVLTADGGRLTLVKPGGNKALQSFIVKVNNGNRYVRQDYGGQPFVQAKTNNTVGLDRKNLLSANWSRFTSWDILTDGWRPNGSNGSWQDPTSKDMSLAWSDVKDFEFLVTLEATDPGRGYMSSIPDQGGSITMARPQQLEDSVKWIMRPEYAGYSAGEVLTISARVVDELVMGRRVPSIPSAKQAKRSASSLSAAEATASDAPGPRPPPPHLSQAFTAPSIPFAAQVAAGAGLAAAGGLGWFVMKNGLCSWKGGGGLGVALIMVIDHVVRQHGK